MSADTAAVLAAIETMRGEVEDTSLLCDVAKAAARLVARIRERGDPDMPWWMDDDGCCALCQEPDPEDDFDHLPDCPATALNAALARLADGAS